MDGKVIFLFLSNRRDSSQSCDCSGFPANKKHLYNICTTSTQRLRRWSNIVQCSMYVLLGMIVLASQLIQNICITFVQRRHNVFDIGPTLFNVCIAGNECSGFPVNTKHLYNICTTSTQRLRRWSKIVQSSYKGHVLCLVGSDHVESEGGGRWCLCQLA